jgi:shikimate kinase
MNIVLIGFRGVGKTTIGKMLARHLGMEFIDADESIERRYGCTVTDIFQKGTESLFRLLESDVINELSKLDTRVIAAGGGAVLKYKNIHNLKRHGFMVLLEADADTIYRRITKDDKTSIRRPRLTGNDLYSEIKELTELRAHYYHSAADCIIDTSNKSAHNIIDEIMHILKQQGYLND